MPTAIIIEDSAIMRTQLRHVLVDAGFTILAEDGTAENLLALYETYHPDLVSLDIVMPGPSGTVAASALLARHPEALVVMCTSLASRSKITACQQAGVAYYLLKPFDPTHAASVFRCAFERARASAP